MKHDRITLILELHIQNERVMVGLYERDSTVRPLREVPSALEQINKISRQIVRLLNKGIELGSEAKGMADELKKNGQLLYDYLLNQEIKEKLLSTPECNVQIILDERLVSIPIELLYDGQEFFCLKYNVGRSVRSERAQSSLTTRDSASKLKMLVIADPSGELPFARKEAKVIQKKFDAPNVPITVSSRVKEVTAAFIQKNIRDYDVIHFAGHTTYDLQKVENSGWIIAGGTFSVTDITRMYSSSPMPALIFSNSCQSAYEQGGTIAESSENNVFSLANAFLMTGVRLFVGTLWKIPDEHSMILADEFYDGIVQSKSVGESLRQARKKVIDKLGIDNMIWASYILYGNPEFRLIDDDRHPLLKNKPSLVLIFNFLLILVLLCYAGLNKLVFSKGRVNKDIKKIKQDFNLGDREKVINKLLNEIKISNSKEKYVKCLVLADEYRSMAQFDPGINIVKEAIYAAQELNAPRKKSKGFCYLGDIIREKLLFSILFVPQSKISDKQLEEAINYYEQAVTFADQAKAPSLKAYSLKGIGEVHKLHYASNQVITYFQKSIDILDRKASLSVQERSDLASMYMDIALAYASGNIDFDKSQIYVKKCHKILTTIPTPLYNHKKQRAIFLKKYDLLLNRIRESGYQSSSFYKRIKKLKEEL